MRSTSFGIEIEAGLGLIDIVSPEGFAFRYGEPAPASETPVFAGIEIGCSRLSVVEAELDAAGETVIRHGGGLTLPRRPDLATTLRFVESGPRA
ncbi:hypothetical protein [Rhabdaerophilum sp. SD176]|uniref:hypothetical protein n=1 Tax=Rhabdaerophilum sp. SD176 TaxID=2983548 RepID=UPI0024DFC587|nr:hypothetical protein [Rhabdaerophilum sp. SD176]